MICQWGLLGVDFSSDWVSQLTVNVTPQLVLTKPTFSLESIIGIAVPLLVVTMASQNIPGLAVLSANHYETPAAPLISTTGLFSLLGAPLGAHTVNLSAIVAAMMASEEAARPAAAVTFLFAASGISILGISGAFWGLLVGVLMVVVQQRLRGS